MPKLSINVDVDDLDKGVAFYSAGLGLTPVHRFGPSAVELAGAEVPVYLLQKPPAAPPFPDAEGGRDYARHWTPVHLDFLVADVERAVLRAVDAGARAESAVESYGWGRIALMADPFGNGFCLIQLDPAGFEAAATPYAAHQLT
jgi:predicted enzyme related to lactoylglutathione lyase